MLVKDVVNRIARETYYGMGYKVRDDYDFEEATHPQEKMCWWIACNAFEIITGDSPDLYADWWEDESDEVKNSEVKIPQNVVDEGKLLKFDEVQNNPQPAGTYSLFISNRGVYSKYVKTATVTIAQWETHRETTRIHRYKSLGKYKVFSDELEWQISILKRVVEKLNNGKSAKDLPKNASSQLAYSKLERWLETA